MFKKIVDKIVHSASQSSHKHGSSSDHRSRRRYGSSSDRPRYSRSSSSDRRHGGHGRHGHSYYKRRSGSSS
ncbi:hypothetical protein [Saccharibacillus alkalitolerans]|uniref:Uncharacterized protein n=1 Tax=Saccharibacillus alkalitolerans TaxID=2705290 RepID=A0ABX0FBZ7_9BACL|nr:hypothetical protein [Saccharibacillus alkalitolerans]NGZ77930.1 hypothetical protein [Saccharibacillus alkalitolerans]